MKIQVKTFLLIARSTDKSIKEKPTHQTAGLPIATIIDLILLGKYIRRSSTGFMMKGHVNHLDAKG